MGGGANIQTEIQTYVKTLHIEYHINLSKQIALCAQLTIEFIKQPDHSYITLKGSVWAISTALLDGLSKCLTTHSTRNTAKLNHRTFFGNAGLVYWDLTLPMFVLKLCNIVYDTP